MAKRKVKRFATGDMVYEDDAPSTPSGRTQMSDPYEDAAEANRARAEAEGAKISEGERVSSMPASEKSTAKNRVVSKKELEASGLSLRDFLNRERGLTRRESAPKIVEVEEAAKSYKSRYTPPGSAPKQTTQKTETKVFMPDRPSNAFPGSKFASGGKVRSASSRADGIAIRGKTRA